MGEVDMDGPKDSEGRILDPEFYPVRSPVVLILTTLLTDWLPYWLIDHLTDWLTTLLTDWLPYWLIDYLTDCMIDYLTDCMIDYLTDWLTDWLALMNDWL